MAELAVAYLSLVPSLKGAGKTIEKELGGIPTDGAGKKVGAGFGAKIGSALKVGAVATGAAVAGVLATSLVKGFGRLNAIDQAEAKLRGLGHSAGTVEAVMENALNSVRGTAFGLEEAATTAAGAMAAGIPQGKELERTLKLTGDAATIAGTDMASMGSIINKVATSDMMQMDVANQLMDAGIPILSMVAEEMGVTADEARKMASEGKISFETFQTALESGLGGAALASGDTFSGAMKNAGAALGRLGAQFLGPAFSQGSGIFMSLTASIDKLGPIAGKAGEVVGGVLAGAMESLSSWMSNIDFGALMTSLQGIVGPALEVWTSFSPLSVALQVLEPLLPMVADLFSQIGAALQLILPPLLAVGTQLVAQLVPVISQLVASVIPPLISIFQSVIPVVLSVVEAIVPLITMLAGLLMPTIEALLPVVSTVFNTVADVIGHVMTVVQGIIQVVTSAIQGDWRGVWEGIKQIFSGVWEAIKSLVTGAVNVVKGVIQAAITHISNVWGVVWSGIRTFFSNTWSAIVSAATGFMNSVKNTFTSVTNFIGSIPSKIMGFFRGIGTWLLDSGKSLIQGFINGIKSAFEGAKKIVSDGLGAIRNLFPFSPAKEGPFSGRGWVAYSGMSLGQTFTESIADSLHDGRKDIHDELGGIQREFDGMDAGFNAGFRLSSASPDAGLYGSSMPGYVVIKDVNDELVGRMRVEADGRISGASGSGSRQSLANVLGVR